MLHLRLIRLKNTLLKCHIVDCEKKFGVIDYVMAYTPKEYLFSINHGFQYTCQSCKRKKKKQTAEYMWIIETNFSSKSLATTGGARGFLKSIISFNIYNFFPITLVMNIHRIFTWFLHLKQKVSSLNDCIEHPSSSFSHQNLRVFPKLKKKD
jgi:hypothetical protein